MSTITDQDNFHELTNHMRHYSNLRFAIMTVFLAVHGAIFSKYLDPAFVKSNPGDLIYLQLLGLFISIIFFIFEFNLNNNLSKFGNSIAQLADVNSAFISHRSTFYKFSVAAATFAIYLLPSFYWLFELINKIILLCS